MQLILSRELKIYSFQNILSSHLSILLSKSLVYPRKGFCEQRHNFSSASVLIITDCKLMERINEISPHSLLPQLP